MLSSAPPVYVELTLNHEHQAHHFEAVLLEVKIDMKRSLAISLIAFALCCADIFFAPSLAQSAPPNTAQATPAAESRGDATRDFRFVVTTKVSTMEKELNQLAAQGFRLERASKSSIGDDVAALVTRDPAAAASAVRYEYKLLSTRKAGTMEKEIREAAGLGFELRGLTSMFRPGIGLLIGDETAAIMERPAGETAKRYEYKLLSTRREKTLQKELDEAVTAGYTPLEMVHGQDNGAASVLLGPQFVNTIILGRRVGGGTGASAGTREYKFLTTTKVGTMEREMNQAAKEGYRFHMSAPDLLMLMSRERGAKEATPYQYKLLATRKTGTMQKELLEQGEQGYSYLATTSGLGGLTTVLERDLKLDAKESRREYKLLAATREKTMQKEIAETLAAGYRILDLTTIGEFILVLDRKPQPTPASANLRGHNIRSARRDGCDGRDTSANTSSPSCLCAPVAL